MRCPKCSSGLVSQEMLSIEVKMCTGCGGLWLEHDRIVAYMQQVLADQDLPNQTIPFLEMQPKKTDIHCPSCEIGLLEQLKLRGIEVERCRECKGVFFDPEELAAIAKRLSQAKKAVKEEIAKPGSKILLHGSESDMETIFGVFGFLTGGPVDELPGSLRDRLSFN